MKNKKLSAREKKIKNFKEVQKIYDEYLKKFQII